MTDGKMFRWYSDEDITKLKADVINTAIEIAVRGVLALDPHVYDEDTVRAAANVVRDSVKERF